MIDVEKLINAGRQLNAVIQLQGGEPVAIIPTGCQVQSLAAFLAPQFIKQSITLNQAESFIAYVNRYKGLGTTIFANVTDKCASFHAAIDYHDKTPERVAHSAFFTCQPTAEWVAWIASDRKDMNQEQFALFLEEHQRLFRAPSGADLLELITTLEGKSHVNFTSGMRLQNGSAKLTFEEDVDLRGGVGTGQIDIPQSFSLALAPFEGEAPYSVSARLRYKINSRKLSFFYETITPHLIIRDAAKLIVERVTNETAVTVLMGRIS